MASTDDTVTWRDRKRHLWPVALLMPLLPFAAVLGFAQTGRAGWLWIGPIVILGVVPVLDLLVGLDPRNPPDDVIERARGTTATTAGSPTSSCPSSTSVSWSGSGT